MDLNQRNKATVWKLWQTLDQDPAKADIPHVDAWHGPEPVGRVGGVDARARLFEPLKRAIPGLTRHVHLFCAGQSDAQESGPDGVHWVVGTGYYVGHAESDLFGIPIAGHDVRLRWGEFLKLDADGHVVYAQTIWDLVDLCDQVGTPVLPRPLGAAHVFPAATAYDGVLRDRCDETVSEGTLCLGRDFIFGGLNGFDESDLSSMGMERFFHPNVKWYGPGGIGVCLSLKEFQDLHQQPWLIAFPDRKVLHLESLFAEDRILAASGPRGVLATHDGPYLGQPATGAKLEVSGLDFWLRTDDQFTENWVFVDMVHLFKQMGVDLLARAAR